ncbi:hypothetical protein KY321_05570, partial [Candidatus Woesearchaeota archaeon]|nr:hypothetical protein [Candidatus Woesearchaeota archaeon]
MWGFKKKKKEVSGDLPMPPSPNGPVLPTPGVVDIPKISGSDIKPNLELNEENIPLMEEPSGIRADLNAEEPSTLPTENPGEPNL